MQETEHTSSIDPDEINKFERMAEEWWDPTGKFRPLHKMNPVRLDYITTQIATEFDRDLTGPAAFEGLNILDIGCGGGLLSEPMARLGANVLGADAAPTNIEVARLHAATSELQIDYRHTTAEALAAEGASFDTVLAMEIIEHVADPAAFAATCTSLVKPGGVVICSTLNRNTKSFLAAIVGAEYVLRWLPKGTHDWNKFLKPAETAGFFEDAGARVVDQMGMVFNPLTQAWSLSPRDLSINYVICAVKPA